MSNEDVNATERSECARRTGIEHCEQSQNHRRAPNKKDRQPSDKDGRKAAEVLINVETVRLEREVYQRALRISDWREKSGRTIRIIMIKIGRPRHRTHPRYCRMRLFLALSRSNPRVRSYSCIQ